MRGLSALRRNFPKNSPSRAFQLLAFLWCDGCLTWSPLLVGCLMGSGDRASLVAALKWVFVFSACRVFCSIVKGDEESGARCFPSGLA
ncbi:hypothetical protein Ancab_016280, partial [Ancistrocladus abbreviatus]